MTLSKSSLFLIFTMFPFILGSYKNTTIFENMSIFLYILCGLIGATLYCWLFPGSQKQKHHISLFQIVSILFLCISFVSMVADFYSMFFLSLIHI